MRARVALVVAALVLLLLPAGVIATSIVVGPLTEQVVEGHTVFTVIEKARFRNETLEAAAVAILVRERTISSSRVKGVLWFNDQYLASGKGGAGNSVFYPCGGAVVGVNQGAPSAWMNFTAPEDYPQPEPPPEDPIVLSEGDFHPRGLAYAGEPDLAEATGSIAFDQGAELDSHEPPPTTFTYNHSYLLTDPNDRTWFVDKYEVTTEIEIVDATGELVHVPVTFPAWVVNLFGRPVFTPKSRYGNIECGPWVDDPWQQAAINGQFWTHDDRLCATKISCPSDAPGALGGDANGDGLAVDGLDAKPPAVGYYEPTDTAAEGAPPGSPSYCYEGNANDDPFYDHDPPPTGNGTRDDPRRGGSGCDHKSTWEPAIGGPSQFYTDLGGNRNIRHTLRLYNALLYFFLDDDNVPVSSVAPHGVADTNGCQSGYEWHCPVVNGEEDDDMEGNSHPFNPPGLYVPAAFDPVTGQQRGGTGEWYDFWAWNRECDLGYDPNARDANGQRVCVAAEHAVHARGIVDLYYLPEQRPPEPQERRFVIFDVEGRLDEFHENNRNPNAPVIPYHPGQPDHDVTQARRGDEVYEVGR